MSNDRDLPERPETLALTEETASVTKQVVETGRVQVKTVTDTVDQAVGAYLLSEAYEVTRVAIDRQVDTAPVIRTEGDVTIVPVLEEVLVVEKRLVLKEEIHLRRRVSTDTVESVVPLRRQRAVVEHVETTGDPVIPTQPKR